MDQPRTSKELDVQEIEVQNFASNSSSTNQSNTQSTLESKSGSSTTTTTTTTKTSSPVQNVESNNSQSAGSKPATDATTSSAQFGLHTPEFTPAQREMLNEQLRSVNDLFYALKQYSYM